MIKISHIYDSVLGVGTSGWWDVSKWVTASLYASGLVSGVTLDVYQSNGTLPPDSYAFIQNPTGSDTGFKSATLTGDSNNTALINLPFRTKYMRLVQVGDTVTAAPAAPTLSNQAGGTLGATTYYVKTTIVTATGETTASSEASLAVAANNILVVTGPASVPNGVGYNVYASSTSGTETLQNSTPVAFGTQWVEPTSGLVNGAAVSVSNTATLAISVNAFVDTI